MNQPLHVRRCHICGEFNESPDDILKCSCCRKSLLPFYYFDKRKISEFTDNGARPPVERDRDRDSGYGPIRGLTVYW